VISVDQRGHGETEGPVGESLDLYAGDVRALLSWLDGPAQLVGASLGGLASVLALADPATRARVSGLVLVDVVPDPDPAHARAFLRRLEVDGSPSRAPQWEWALVEDILSRSVELRQAAAALRVPVTLVHGTASEVFRDADAQRFREVVGHMVLRDVEGAGHLVARDRPDELADALLEHLERASAAAAADEGGRAPM
jgi:pimeloyl-ACP methyl ester carboxylesterase